MRQYLRCEALLTTTFEYWLDNNMMKCSHANVLNDAYDTVTRLTESELQKKWNPQTLNSEHWICKHRRSPSQRIRVNVLETRPKRANWSSKKRMIMSRYHSFYELAHV